MLLERLLPFDVGQGQPLSDGSGRLEYRLNGHRAFWVSGLACVPRIPGSVGGRVAAAAARRVDAGDSLSGLKGGAEHRSLSLRGLLRAHLRQPCETTRWWCGDRQCPTRGLRTVETCATRDALPRDALLRRSPRLIPQTLAVAEWQGIIRLAWLQEHFVAMAGSTCVACFVFSFVLYAASFRRKGLLLAKPAR